MSDYPYHFSTDDLQFGIEIPENINKDYNDSVRIFSHIGVLILNMKIVNESDFHYIVERDGISFNLAGGERLKPLERDEILRLTAGVFGLPMYFLGVAEGYSNWALPETSIIGPGQAVEGYIFFRVDERYDMVRSSAIRVAPIRTSKTAAFQHTFSIGEGSE